MPLVVPPVIADYLTEVERNNAPIGEVALYSELLKRVPKDTPFTKEEKIGLWAGIYAFQFSPAYNNEREPWGTYFMPMGSGTRADGTVVYYPDAAEITLEILDHWKNRATATPHPTFKARYSDLVWEFSKMVPSAKRDNVFAAMAIDAYLNAINAGIAEDEHQEWRFADRAIELAIEIKDEKRLTTAKDALFGIFRRYRDKSEKFMWWKLPDLAWNRKGLKLSDAERQEIIDGLEQALVICSDTSNGERFDPHLATDAAIRLADCYRESGKNDDAKRVILAAGNVFEGASTKASGMVAVAWLEDVLRKYRGAGLDSDAVRVERMIKERSADARAEMKRIEVSTPIDRQEYEDSLNKLTEGGLETALKRIALEFLSKQDFVHKILREHEKDAPLTAHLSMDITHTHGFTAARVGSIQDDFNGRTIRQASDIIGYNAQSLHHAFERLKSRYAVDIDKIIGFLKKSEIFAIDHEAFLRDGITAWLAGDYVKAIHVLVPQVEALLRVIAGRIGIAIMKPNQHGGFDVITMGAILNDKTFQQHFEINSRLHLIALYADPRGLNVRNDLCHGLLSYDRLTVGLANWVVHSLLFLSMLSSAPPQKTKEPALAEAGADE